MRSITRREIAGFVLSLICATGFASSCLAQSGSTPSPNMPSEEEIAKKLNAMSPEKKKQLAEALDQYQLMTDLQSGTCKRAAEVNMKAIQGDPQSIYWRSSMYQKGYCVAQDRDRFHADLEQASTLGIAGATADIGEYVMRGEEGYQQNMGLARAWFEKSVAQGGPPRAFMTLGGLLILGGGGPKDSARGVRLVEQAAAAKDSDLQTSNSALTFLAKGYIQGEYLPKDIPAGRTYALKGAAQCDATAMNLVATSYSLEAPPNLVREYAWANVATAHGDNTTDAEAVKIRAAAEQAMSKKAIAQAQALTANLPVCKPN